MGKNKKDKKKKVKLNAKGTNKHLLYEASVQNADFDAAFMNKWFKKYRGRKPVSIKEDFCGTASFCCEWVKLDKEKVAIGVDLDEPTLEWGRENKLSKLKQKQLDRVELIHDNVLNVTKPQVDIVVAFNFSFCIFKQREQLLTYFKAVHKSLGKDGLFAMDIFGGSEAITEMEEESEKKGFTYVWEHAKFNPITNEILCHIHFDFPDGSRMKKAFTYDWRLWSIPELRELLAEAGFSKSEILWEGTDPKTESGNGVWKKTEKGEACESHIAYVIGLK